MDPHVVAVAMLTLVTGCSSADPGENTGAKLEAYQHLDMFWFAWASLHLDTDVIDSPEQNGAP